MSPVALSAYQFGERLLSLGIASQSQPYAKLWARTKRIIARALGAHADEVWLTSGGTEGNAWVLEAALLRARAQGGVLRVVTSMLEHPSVAANLDRHAQAGALRVLRLPTDGQGRAIADPACLGRFLEPDLISVMLANNETGVVQDVAHLMASISGPRTLRHADGVQLVGRLPFAFDVLPLDLVTLAGHKVGAGHGAGVLLLRRGLHLDAPPMFGPAKDNVLPGGSHLPAALALAASLTEVSKSMTVRAEIVARARDVFESELQRRCGPVVVLGQDAPRLPNTSCVRFVGCAAETLLVALDGLGFGVSLGSACSSGISSPSPSVRAMGLNDKAAREVLRVSWPMQGSDPMASALGLVAALEPLCAALRA